MTLCMLCETQGACEIHDREIFDLETAPSVSGLAFWPTEEDNFMDHVDAELIGLRDAAREVVAVFDILANATNFIDQAEARIELMNAVEDLRSWV